MPNREEVMKKLSTVEDPELHLDIVRLGLIYDVEVEKSRVNITMTFTTPFCPYGPALEGSVKEAVSGIDGVENVNLEITFDPPWDISRLTDDARAELGLD